MNETEQYRCDVCRKRFQRLKGQNVSCCVVHARGDCCHFMETEVTRKGWAKR